MSSILATVFIALIYFTASCSAQDRALVYNETEAEVCFFFKYPSAEETAAIELTLSVLYETAVVDAGSVTINVTEDILLHTLKYEHTTTESVHDLLIWVDGNQVELTKPASPRWYYMSRFSHVSIKFPSSVSFCSVDEANYEDITQTESTPSLTTSEVEEQSTVIEPAELQLSSDKKEEHISSHIDLESESPEYGSLPINLTESESREILIDTTDEPVPHVESSKEFLTTESSLLSADLNIAHSLEENKTLEAILEDLHNMANISDNEIPESISPNSSFLAKESYSKKDEPETEDTYLRTTLEEVESYDNEPEYYEAAANEFHDLSASTEDYVHKEEGVTPENITQTSNESSENSTISHQLTHMESTVIENISADPLKADETEKADIVISPTSTTTILHEESSPATETNLTESFSFENMQNISDTTEQEAMHNSSVSLESALPEETKIETMPEQIDEEIVKTLPEKNEETKFEIPTKKTVEVITTEKIQMNVETAPVTEKEILKTSEPISTNIHSTTLPESINTNGDATTLGSLKGEVVNAEKSQSQKRNLKLIIPLSLILGGLFIASVIVSLIFHYKRKRITLPLADKNTKTVLNGNEVTLEETKAFLENNSKNDR